VVSHHGVVQDTTEYALVRMTGTLAVALPLLALIQVLTDLHDYQQPAVAVVVWLAMFPAALWLVPRVRMDGLARHEEVAAILIAIAAVAVIGWDHRPQHATGPVDLSVLGIAWLLALLAVTSPPRVWVPGALAVFAVHTAVLVGVQGANRLSLTQLEAGGYITATVLFAYAAVRPAMAAHARISAQSAWLTSQSEAERAAAEAVQLDRHNRLALLELEALPLLRAIADGKLNPADDDVRERCAGHAAALRHSLTDRTPRGDLLLAALKPVLAAASARGLLTDVRMIGDPGVPSAAITEAVLDTVGAVLEALPPHQVLLTVLASAGDVELFVTFEQPPRDSPDLTRSGRDVLAAARWQASITTEDTGAGYLRIGWRKAVPGDRLH
jgi:hypothetical protein